jgi:hypothetical protein
LGAGRCSMKPFLALLSLALLMAIVNAKVSNDASEVNSSEIIKKIQTGMPVTYDNVVIRGDLNLSDLDLPRSHVERTLPDIASGLSEEATLINSPIRINNSRFEGDLNFNNIIFNNSINFVKSQFIKDFFIRGSEFREYANFEGSKFSGTSQFRNSWFRKDVSFSNAAFSGLVNFSDSRFAGDVAFVRVDFQDFTTFFNSRFEGDVHFDSSLFDEDFLFTSTNLGYSRFGKYTDFSDVTFNGDALFDKINFANDADFRDAEFNKFLSLESSLFDGDALFQNATFRDGISLKRTKYNRLFISFDSIKNGLVFDPASYQLLIKNFNDLGFFIDADNCYFQFMKKQLKYRDPINSPILFIFDLASYLFYGYGVRVSYPTAWSVLTVALFGIYWRKKGVKEPLRFSILLFLSGSKFFIEAPKRPSEHNGSLLKDMFLMEKILGAIFSVLFFLTISKMLVRG